MTIFKVELPQKENSAPVQNRGGQRRRWEHHHTGFMRQSSVRSRAGLVLGASRAQHGPMSAQGQPQLLQQGSAAARAELPSNARVLWESNSRWETGGRN